MADLTKAEITDVQADEADAASPVEALEAEPFEPGSEESSVDSQPAPPREFSPQARRLMGVGALLLGVGIYWLRLNNILWVCLWTMPGTSCWQRRWPLGRATR
jgi:hypothetical protein